MLDNSTTFIQSFERVVEPISIIGLAIGIFGVLQSSLFTYTAIVGLGKPDGRLPVPPEWGKPWPFSIATGLNGKRPNVSDPLEGAGGPFPDVHLL